MLWIFSVCSNLLYNPRSWLTRSVGFIAIASVCLFSIAYLTYCLPDSSSGSSLHAILPHSLASNGARSPKQLPWSENTVRLVVFGDSWSDNGQYPVDPPPEDQLLLRDGQQGRIWTDWLCVTVGDHTCPRKIPLLTTI